MSDTITVAAECLGVKVPASRFLNETRIRRINAARYEGQEIAGALHVVTPEDTVLEIGAGLGIVGAVVARNAEPRAIRSFEANPELIPEIEALYALNGLEDRISVQNTVLFTGPDRPDTVPFHLRNSFLGSSLINRSGRPSRTVDVPTADFGAVCAVVGPTVLVMDIEGGEMDLLRHADLSGFRALVIEFHPEAYGIDGMRACKTILREAGFERVDEVSTRTVWTCVRPEA
ncbi:methyltransferase, FkbM family [Cribrihabitans marinus]|uniref:Methyltransferase, FkbM family n=1 Tax=Cribrihabitans marinus TaxID=1227549 RepID=A0A1H6SGF0_9RHOB|nr:FkbM family methyltransferase [Cribrihabitans marinus]GGH23835.1 hypothetical protein GCM10010973_09990 [Cribrihabitans marinus]SEI63897.1 methyltransferase, FkbM family [Cribrihabitans marinus]